MAVLALVMTFVLISNKADPVMIAIVAGQFGQTALTALITLLTNTRTQQGPPQSVTMVNPAPGVAAEPPVAAVSAPVPA